MNCASPPNWSQASLHLREAEECITHQQKIAERLEALGHRREARQAREMLATFVKSYLAMQDCRETMEFHSFAALAKTWLTFAVELNDPKAFLDALRDVPALNSGSRGCPTGSRLILNG